MPRRAARGPPKQKTTILFKAGNLPSTPDELFRRVFWKSDFLAGETHNFWREVKRAEPAGLPIQARKDWISKRGMSVGQFYNTIHGRAAAGLSENKESRCQFSSSHIPEPEQMLYASSHRTGVVEN